MQMPNVYLASILSFEYLELRKYILFRKHTSMKQETVVDLSHASLISYYPNISRNNQWIWPWNLTDDLEKQEGTPSMSF